MKIALGTRMVQKVKSKIAEIDVQCQSLSTVSVCAVAGISCSDVDLKTNITVL